MKECCASSSMWLHPMTAIVQLCDAMTICLIYYGDVSCAQTSLQIILHTHSINACTYVQYALHTK